MRSILIFAILLSVSRLASAGHSVALDVRNFASSGSDGYTNTTASNGKTYSYKYTGGTDNNGNVTVNSSEGKNVTITLHLQSDPRYTIDSVTFVDPHQQLSIPNPKGQKNVTIQDKNDFSQTATYKVTVKDSTANATLPCDPQIINK